MAALTLWVYDAQTNEPIRAAKCTVQGHPQYTTPDGRSSFYNLMKGYVNVIVEKYGYVTHSELVTLQNDDQWLTVTLSHVPTPPPEIPPTAPPTQPPTTPPTIPPTAPPTTPTEPTPKAAEDWTQYLPIIILGILLLVLLASSWKKKGKRKRGLDFSD